MLKCFTGTRAVTAYGKRLEAGTFEFPKSVEKKVEIDLKKLMLILEGISLGKIKQRKRFSLKV